MNSERTFDFAEDSTRSARVFSRPQWSRCCRAWGRTSTTLSARCAHRLDEDGKPRSISLIPKRWISSQASWLALRIQNFEQRLQPFGSHVLARS